MNLYLLRLRLKMSNLQRVVQDSWRMNRRYFFMKALCGFVFILCSLKAFVVFLSLTRREDYFIKGSFNQSLIYLNLETVDENMRQSEKLFHNLVHDYYKKYNSFYRPELAKALNETELLTTVEKSGIIPKCDQAPYLLIQVHSASINVKKRLAIRHSWGNKAAFYRKTTLNVRTIFVVGRSRLKSVDDIIFREAREYEDILLTEFFDSYRRLSHKTLLALKWANSRCLPKYMLKTDDDCYVNIPNILDYLTSYPFKDLYTGRIQWFMPANRNKSSKFYTSEKEYNKLVFPPYASGGGYIFSGNLIPRLVNASVRLSIIPNEDAYFGTLIDAIGVLPTENTQILPFIYCNSSIWDRPSCDFLLPFVIHGVHNYAQLWIHYHVKVLSLVTGLCKQSIRNRHKLNIPLYCHTDLT